MAKRQIIKTDDPVLREISKEVVDFDNRLHILLDDMAETMHAADGLGLAAVQVGILKRAAIVYDDNNKKIIELVNPKIVWQKGAATGQEGCLSVPGKNGYVLRPKKLTVEAQDRHGNSYSLTTKGLTAVAICHELDHLDGILYTDKLTDNPNIK